MIKIICACDGVLNGFDPDDWHAMNGELQGLLKKKMDIEKSHAPNDNNKHELYDEATDLSNKLGMRWNMRLFTGITHNDLHVSDTFYWHMKFTEQGRKMAIQINRSMIKVVE